MGNRWRKLSIVISLILTMSMCMPQFAWAGTMNKPTATNVKYYTKNGKKTGIERFTIAPFTYYSIGRDKSINPNETETLVLNTAKLKTIAAKEIFPRWGVIAEGIFRDKADQLVTIEGSGMMSSDKKASNSFDRQFNYEKKDINEDYKSYKWSIGDFAKTISSESSQHNGEQNWDEMRATGITSISSLADARKKMGQELRNCSDDNDNTVDDFLGNSKDKTSNEYRLPDLENSKSGSGFASIVTCVNRAGASGDYDYVSFGLAVYDFDVSPIAASDLQYITAADKVQGGKDIIDGLKGNVPWKDATGLSFEEIEKEAKQTILVNKDNSESEMQANLEKSTSIENSLSTEESFQWGMTQHVGTDINIGSSSANFAAVTVQLSNEWSELWSTTKGTGHSESESQSKSASTTVALPPHTTATIVQNETDTNIKERYQQPVVLSYKVAVFAMSGDYFNGWAGGINSSRYDKQWMSILFDGSDQEETSGCSALGSLYNRAVANRDIHGYDGSMGKLNSWCDKGAWKKNGHIKWEDIEQELSDDNEIRSTHTITSKRTGGKCTLTDLASELPMIEQAFVINTKKEVMISDLNQKIPLYNLNSADLKDKTKKRYLMKPDDILYLDSLDMTGYNSYGVEYYGFDQSWGRWQLLDKNKKPIEDGSKADEDKINGQVTSGNFTLVSDDFLDVQYVEAGEPTGGSSGVYLKWAVDPDVKSITSNELLEAYGKGRRTTPYMTSEELAQIETPYIQLGMKKASASSMKASGKYTGLVDEKVNLNSVLSASALCDADDSDERAQLPVYWEAKDNAGIDVEKNGDCICNAPGDYQVRAYCYEKADEEKLYSDWVDIEAREAPVLTSVRFDKEKLDKLSGDLVISKDKPTVTVDLDDCLLYLDQNGEEMEPYSYDEEHKSWSQLVSEVTFALDNDAPGLIHYPGLLMTQRPGTYIVSGRAYDSGSNKTYDISPAPITVSGNEYLSSIVFAADAFEEYGDLKLKDKNDTVVIHDLESKVRYLNQDGDPWTGTKPKVTFSVDTGDAPDGSYVFKDGDLYVKKAGYFNLWLESEGGFFDYAGFNVEDRSDLDNPDNLVISIHKTEDVKLDSNKTPTDLDVERAIDYMTVLGTKWEGVVPELSFSLDSGVSGASLEKRSQVIDDETGQTREYTSFVAKEPGTYVVHVKAADPAQYSKQIDDIKITVTSDKKEEGSEGTTEKKSEGTTEKKSGKKTDQKLTVKTTTRTIKYKKLAKKKKTVAPLKVSGAKGKVTYKKVSVSKKKYARRFTVNKNTGKITVKKKTKKGTYKIKIKVTAAGDSTHNAATKTVTAKIKVK